MPRVLRTIALVLSLGLPAVAQADGLAGQADAQALKDMLTGDAKGAAKANPQCKLFSVAEMTSYIGAPALAGGNAAMGFGCQWIAPGTGGNNLGDIIVSVVPAEYYVQPSLADGYKDLEDFGVKAFVVPEMGGWAAGSIVGNDAVNVSLVGPAATETSTIELLKEAIKRRHP